MQRNVLLNGKLCNADERKTSDFFFFRVLHCFTQFFPTCGRMPALSLWPGRQSYRLRLVGGRKGGGLSSVAPRSRNPPTGRRRDI